MRSRLTKWGKKLVVPIPVSLAQKLEWRDGIELKLTPLDDGFVVQRRTPQYSLAELLAQITPEAIHTEEEWSPAKPQNAASKSRRKKT